MLKAVGMKRRELTWMLNLESITMTLGAALAGIAAGAAMGYIIFFGERALAAVERLGNRLPDPALLFIALLLVVWVVSWALSGVDFNTVDPRTGKDLQVVNQLSGTSMTAFMSVMVKNFAHFHPIGVVLVAMLGIGVAEHTGFINTALRAMMNVTGRWLLTPMIILVGIVSHTAADAGYVMVIEAAKHLPRIFPMMMTPAGTIAPARVFIIGAGVAGLLPGSLAAAGEARGVDSWQTDFHSWQRYSGRRGPHVGSTGLISGSPEHM